MTNTDFEKKLKYFQEFSRNFPSITKQLDPAPIQWDVDNMELTLAFHTNKEMANPIGGLHGGIIATIFDNGLGVLAGCFAEGVFTPTVAMNLEYLRPAPAIGKLFLHASITKLGRKLIHLRGELLDAPDSKMPYAVATSIYALHKTAKI